MAERKKMTKDQLKEKLEPVSEAVTKTVKDAAEKAAPAVKAAGRTLKETGKKAASALVPEVYVQWQGREIRVSETVEAAKAAYRAENKGAIRSCRVYLKPEDGAVYYVINEKEGKLPL